MPKRLPITNATRPYTRSPIVSRLATATSGVLEAKSTADLSLVTKNANTYDEEGKKDLHHLGDEVWHQFLCTHRRTMNGRPFAPMIAATTKERMVAPAKM